MKMVLLILRPGTLCFLSSSNPFLRIHAGGVFYNMCIILFTMFAMADQSILAVSCGRPICVVPTAISLLADVNSLLVHTA